MAVRKLPPQDVLRKILDYDADAGLLTWRLRKAEDGFESAPRWNTQHAGKPALSSINVEGYCHGSLLGRHAMAHRVIYKWMTGQDPNRIDHVNGNRSDNRWDNIRSVSPLENGRNAGVSSRNKSGVTGVSWTKQNGMWRAQIKTKDGLKHLGFFACIKQAARARRIAEGENGYHENHGMRPSNNAGKEHTVASVEPVPPC